MIQKEMLEQLLRLVGPLSNIRLEYASPLRASLAPWEVKAIGTVNINGEPMQFDTDIDLRDYQGMGDIDRLIRLLLAAFDKAERPLA